ncbi:copper chaperone PCu(A)C [uncultured Citricoccus sp.]|uniref:copper chaperone PCu(A)C n=1 Tax=uncultured Citricoccus sp. TaxID=614031 RepID=UPI00262C6CE0|nr:copper chaperone PCu(A)C [uncultured Citricoccus sp.]
MTAHPVRRRTRPAPRRSALALPALALAGALLLTGCAQPAPQAAGPASSEAAAGAVTGTTGSPITVTDPWAKATEEAMTGVFGTVQNASDRDVRITGASTDLAATAELHETVDDGTGATLMREVQGGLTIPAGGSLELVPGGHHIMLMGLRRDIAPGDVVEVRLEFEDGRTLVLTAPAKEFAGAQEEYRGTGEMDAGGETDAGGHAGAEGEGTTPAVQGHGDH